MRVLTNPKAGLSGESISWHWGVNPLQRDDLQPLIIAPGDMHRRLLSPSLIPISAQLEITLPRHNLVPFRLHFLPRFWLSRGGRFFSTLISENVSVTT
jgi:hypothetical protein